MTKSRSILFALAALALLISVGTLFHLYNTGQQETEQQAIESLDRGIALFRENKYAESLEELQSIPDGVIRDWHLPFYLASAQVKLKDYQAAVPLLEEALTLNSQETLILFQLGVVYFKLGKLELSKGYFAKVFEIDPTNEEAKGLMDIMSKLERQQPGVSGEETSRDDETGAEDH